MLLSWTIKGFKFLVGAAFCGVLLLALIVTAWTAATTPAQKSAEEEFHLKPKELSLPSDGIFGQFTHTADSTRQLQRGFKVYKEVCANCHSLNQVSFRDLRDLQYSEAEVKKIAKDWATKQPVFDAKAGSWGERDNTPADHFPKVYYAGTGTPPDLTLMTKARKGGAAYVYSLLTGYQDKQPAELLKHFPGAKTPENSHYNPYFANLNIAMPPPLTTEGQVEYTDGTRASVDQMAKDVSAFLVWTAEPTLQTRHQFGFAVLGFLILATILAWGAYKSVWEGKAH